MFRHQPNFYLLGQDSYDHWIGAAGALEVGRLRIPTNSLGSTYFTYQTSPALNTKHHLRLVSNDHIELREGATIGGLDAESRVSIFTLDPGAFCSTFDNTDMPGMKYHTYDHLGNLRVTYRRAGASLPVDATYEYSPYGRVVQTYQAAGRDRYLSTGHEREEATNYDYRLARLYDAELGRFLGVDVMAGKFPGWSSYSYVLNNPVRFTDPNGKEIDISKLSASERARYFQNIATLSNNPLFSTYYNRLQLSKTVYSFGFGSGAGGSGSFNSRSNEIFALDNLESMAQEMFHAYQTDLGVYTDKDQSVREAEGDLVSTNIATSLGRAANANSWDNGIGYDFMDRNFDTKVLSPEFDRKFNSAVNNRIKFYLDRLSDDGAESSKSYLMSNSRVGALGLKKLVREVDAHKNMVGPRMENGDFYTE